MTLHVVAHFRFRPGAAEQALPHLQRLIPPTREEDGCITYLFALDQDDPSHIVFIEEWRERGAFEQHLLSPTLVEVLSIVEPLLREPIAAYELQDVTYSD